MANTNKHRNFDLDAGRIWCGGWQDGDAHQHPTLTDALHCPLFHRSRMATGCYTGETIERGKTSVGGWHIPLDKIRVCGTGYPVDHQGIKLGA